MIQAGENQTVAFKRDLSKASDFAGEMIAFANTDGGTILLGVADDGKIIGVADSEHALQTLAGICRDNCRSSLYPQIETIQIDGATIITMAVAKKLRTQPPYENNSGQCYVRVGNVKQLASQYKRAQLMERQSISVRRSTSAPVYI